MTKAVAALAMRSNIWKLYIVQSFTQALFAIPIIFLFWQSHGLTMQHVFLIQSIFAVTILVLEIPTGYIADKWGRKNAIVAGCFFDVIGYLIYAQSTEFWHFLMAEIVIGIGVSLLSGALEAITYDTLLSLGKEKDYRRLAGNQTFLEFGMEALSSLIGGAVALSSLILPFWLTVIPMAIAFVIALTLHEPPRHKIQGVRHWKVIWDVSVQTLIRHRGLRSIIILHGAISVLTLTFFWFFQPYQQLVGVPIVFFGITHAVIVAAGAFASKYVALLEKKVDDRLLLMGIAAVVVVCFLILGLPPALWLVPAFLFSRIVWGALGPLTADMVNRMATSDVRATVLSLRSFPSRLMFVCASPWIGVLADIVSIPTALLITGVIGTVMVTTVFIAMQSVWKEIPA